mmetsp:Transcript_1753/g.10794  ORF Transcript_1753/g.10794 Transcript_1753/m.10794 type:complete len:123 (-) Transcript_1753:967-1335(-)
MAPHTPSFGGAASDPATRTTGNLVWRPHAGALNRLSPSCRQRCRGLGKQLEDEMESSKDMDVRWCLGLVPLLDVGCEWIVWAMQLSSDQPSAFNAATGVLIRSHFLCMVETFAPIKDTHART